MEDKIKHTFDSLTMPEACDAKIRASLRRPARHVWRPLAAAACLILAVLVLVLVQPPVVQALENTVEKIINHLFVYDMFPGATLTDVRYSENGSLVEVEGTDANGNPFWAACDDMSMPDWLDPREDGLYYISDGHATEISALISEDTPFTAQFTDKTGIRHYIAIGGTYGSGDTAMDHIGWADWTQRSLYGDTNWLSGRARNHLDADGNERGWITSAKKSMGIPWS